MLVPTEEAMLSFKTALLQAMRISEQVRALAADQVRSALRLPQDTVPGWVPSPHERYEPFVVLDYYLVNNSWLADVFIPGDLLLNGRLNFEVRLNHASCDFTTVEAVVRHVACVSDVGLFEHGLKAHFTHFTPGGVSLFQGSWLAHVRDEDVGGGFPVAPSLWQACVDQWADRDALVESAIYVYQAREAARADKQGGVEKLWAANEPEYLLS